MQPVLNYIIVINCPIHFMKSFQWDIGPSPLPPYTHTQRTTSLYRNWLIGLGAIISALCRLSHFVIVEVSTHFATNGSWSTLSPEVPVATTSTTAEAVDDVIEVIVVGHVVLLVRRAFMRKKPYCWGFDAALPTVGDGAAAGQSNERPRTVLRCRCVFLNDVSACMRVSRNEPPE